VCGGIHLREEDEGSAVNASEVNGAVVEGGEELFNVWSHRGPKGREESGPEAFRSRAGEFVHGGKSPPNLLQGKRGAKTLG
jgi:hypothetical protein